MYSDVAKALGVKVEMPELDTRTAFWINAFTLLCRGRPQAMSGIAAIPPTDIITLALHLDWPCEIKEAVEVLTAMDNQYIEMHSE